MTSGVWRLSLIAVAAFDAALVLGFLFPALHHPIALAASPLIGVGLRGHAESADGARRSG